jgi:hypothetical protein
MSVEQAVIKLQTQQQAMYKSKAAADRAYKAYLAKKGKR